MARMKILKSVVIAIGIAILLLFGWVALRRNAPPLRMIQAANQVTIDVQTLGEYPTTVNRIRLLDMNRSVVWEIAAQGRAAQIRQLALRAGNNQSQVEAEYGAYRVVTPRSEDHFTLSRSMRYTIELWGSGGLLSRSSTTFVLGN
jgi:hypothetical protein